MIIMISVEELKKEFMEDAEKAKKEYILRTIEEKVKEIGFRFGRCDVHFSYSISGECRKEILEHLKEVGYETSTCVSTGKDEMTFHIYWNTTTEEDRYYITNSDHPQGNFMVARLGAKDCNNHYWQRKIECLQYRGNYFKTREEAQEMCDKFNSMLKPGLIEG